MSRRGCVKGWIIFGVIHKLYRFLANAQRQFPALAGIWQALFMAGNTSDKTTLPDFLKKIEEQYGKDEPPKNSGSFTSN